MKLKQTHRICPVCLGEGRIKEHSPQSRYTPEVRAKARKLFREGLSLRKIGKEIGVNHPQKVYSLIISKL